MFLTPDFLVQFVEQRFRLFQIGGVEPFGRRKFRRHPEDSLSGSSQVLPDTTNNLGGEGNETEVYFVVADEVILGEVDAIEIELSREAAYKTTGGTVVSSFQRDQSLIRAKLLHDLVVRHPEAIAIKTAVTWGS